MLFTRGYCRATRLLWINVRRERNRIARSRGFRNYAEMSEYVP